MSPRTDPDWNALITNVDQAWAEWARKLGEASTCRWEQGSPSSESPCVSTSPPRRVSVSIREAADRLRKEAS